MNNRIYTLILGNGVPESLRGTTDSTFYTHYSALSTVQANWDLMALGRGDVNGTLNNVFGFVANASGYTNNGITGDSPAIRASPPSPSRASRSTRLPLPRDDLLTRAVHAQRS